MIHIRLDRLVTLFIAEPLNRRGSADRGKVPVLMYHSISDEDESRVRPYYQVETHPYFFMEQMRFLRDSGYFTVNPRQAIEYLRSPSEGEKKPIVITFDDGFRNFYTDAFPTLNDYGFVATMYLPTDYIGHTRRSFKGKECLIWSEVRDLAKCGITYGSHTMSHPVLYGMDWQAIERELTISRQTIEQELGIETTSFAYPYAFPTGDRAFARRFREMLQQCGYTDGVCTTIGCCSSQTDPLFLNRLPVNSCDDDLLLQAKLNGSYDWLAVPQHLSKTAKKWLGTSH